MVNIRIYGYCDTLLMIFCMRVFSQNSGTYCMVPSDWDLALTCICGPNFRSNSSENFPDFLFVCLFVWLNQTRTVKPLRRFHSWSSIFTQDGLAFSTKTARRVCLIVCLSTSSPLCICNRDKRPHFSLKRFRLDSKSAYAPGSLRTKSLETAATRVVTGISHWIPSFCDRY